MGHKKYKKNGFTLFELLIVIFIIGTVSSLLVINMRKGEKQYELQITAQEIAQSIRRAQDMALTSFKYSTTRPPPFNYGVYFRRSDRTFYRIFADNDGDYRYDGSSELVETVNISSGVELAYLYTKTSPSSGMNSRSRIYLTFSLPDGFTKIKWSAGAPDDYAAIIRIRRSDGTCPDDCKDIIIEETGRISIQ